MTFDWPSSTVLLTGTTGWLGRRLITVLTSGLPDDERFRTADPRLTIRGLVEPGVPSAELPPGITTIAGDLRDPAACDRLCAGAAGSVLIHTAGLIHPRRWVRDFDSINVEGTRVLLEAAARAGVRRAVLVSSNSPFGCNPTRDHRFDEDSPFQPYLRYGRSKMQMEHLGTEFHQSGRLEVVVVRPTWFYGPQQPARQTLFFRMIRDGRAPIVGDGGNLRSMTYLDNLCQGLMLAALVPQAAGRRYWIADERPYTMNEIVDTIEQLLEQEFGIPCRHKRLRLPFLAGQVAQVVDSALQAVGLYHQKIHVLGEMNKNIACRIDGANKELGYQPHVSLEEGMRRSIAWVRAELG